VCFNIEINILD